MSAAAIRIAGNDDRLAHGMARKGVNMFSQRSERLVQNIVGATTLKSFLTAVEKTYAGRIVVWGRGDRLTGSRTDGWAVVLGVTNNEDLRVMMFTFDGRCQSRKVTAHQSKIIVKRHVLARMMQRSTGTGNAEVAGYRVGRHIEGLFEFLGREDMVEGAQFRLSGFGGAICGAIENNLIIVKTWLSSASISDTKARAKAEADEWTMEVSQ